MKQGIDPVQDCNLEYSLLEYVIFSTIITKVATGQQHPFCCVCAGKAVEKDIIRSSTSTKKGTPKQCPGIGRRSNSFPLANGKFVLHLKKFQRFSAISNSCPCAISAAGCWGMNSQNTALISIQRIHFCLYRAGFHDQATRRQVAQCPSTFMYQAINENSPNLKISRN